MKDYNSDEPKSLFIREKLLTSAVSTPIETYFESFKSGSFGFLIVLSLIIISKLFAFSLSSIEHFSISINDIVFSFWGFIVLSFVVFISKIKNNQE